MRDSNKLTDKQKAFCDAYLISGDVKQASIASGYTLKGMSAYRLLKMVKVDKYLKARKSQLDKQVEKGFKWKANKLNTIVECIVGETKDEVDKQYANTAIGAISELNKMCGHYAPTKTIQVNLNDDPHIKRLNEVTCEIMKEQEDARKIESQSNFEKNGSS
jgi:phage terminase small subunit